MRKTKKALAMLMAAALFAGPCVSGRSMYEVHAEDAGNEEVISMQETPTQETLAKGQASQEEDGGQEQIMPVQEEAQETPEEMQEKIKETKEAAQGKVQDREEYVEEGDAALSEQSLQVAESSRNTGNSEESILKVTGIALSQETQVQLNPLAVPREFTVNVSIDDPADREIDSIRLWYCSEETGKSHEYTASYYDSAVSGNIYPVDVSVNKYITSGKYTLQEIEVTIVADKSDGIWRMETYSYTYNSEKRVFESNETEYDAESGSWICAELAYAGELDFSVTGTESDEFIPYITFIEKVTTGEIYSATPVQFNIGYVEQGSGVKSINVYFSMEGNAAQMDRCSFSASSEKELVGEGTIMVSSLDSYGRATGKYNIDSLEIEDYAGNRVSYLINEENTMLIGSRDEEESKVAAEGCSYTVLPAKAYIELKSLKAAAGTDKDHLAAGNTLSIVATVRNVASDSIRIKSDECSIVWEREGTEDNKREWGYSAGEEVSINPDQEKEIIFQVTPNQYSATGKRSLDSLNFCIKSSDDVVYRSCSVREGQITMGDGMGNSLCTLAYNGEADYTVTVSPTPDEEAPYIEDISVLTKNVKAPGEVKLAIKTRDEGFAKAESIRYKFTDTKNSKNTFGVGKGEDNKEIKYSEADHAYICTIQIPATIIKGTYEMEYIILYDVAENGRVYSMKEGKLADTEGNECPACVIEVTESETDDDDFDGPVLTAFELLNGQETVSAGSKIQLRMKAEDASGISKVGLNYCKVAPTGALIYTSTMYMEESESVLGAEGYSLYNFSVDKYCKTGQYQLLSVTIYDDSVRKNTTGFSYQEGKLWNYLDNSTVPVNGNVNLKVTQMEDIVIVDPAAEDITAAIADIEKNGTVVVKGSNMGEQTLPKSFMQTIKEKEVTVIVSDSGSKSELVIQGAALGTVQEDLELSVYRDEAVKETVMVNNTRDNIYYPVTVVTSDTTIPVTIRIKLDDDFRKKCGDNPVRLSRETADGSMALIRDRLKISEDGYVEVVFENGLAGGGASKILYADGENIPGESSDEIRYIVSSQIVGTEAGTGDINADGKVDILDLMLCLNHVSRKSELTGDRFQIADVDGNGKVDLLDLMRILNYVSKKTETV